MKWEFDTERPIYVQLVGQLRTFILNGDYPPGERLPSVRDLALEMRVNPNTMQRALAELEASGLIETQRTSGKFVTQDAELIRSIKEAQARTLVEAYFAGAAKIGLDRRQAAELIQKEEEL